MMKKIVSVIMITGLVCSLIGCGQETSAQVAELSAVTRDASTEDGTVWFDEDAIALEGSIVTDDMSEEQRQRAEELHEIAETAFAEVNARRVENGVAELTWSEGLEKCALVRAKEIVTLFSHTRPNGRAWYTVDSNLMWGENLAKGYATAEDAVEAWMASPSHAANILQGRFTSCSIAVFENNGTLYFAQEFAY